ncbi:hypothetical protein B9G39_21600 [Zooshikella ganghwensis]|uniref:Uncharacterized protein n=1 Tax=Zooshikella ganghwensis TaxID=202772 RepID=A0A4P9VQK9_9GAMM|nr:hypothetical protein B9G39_21600 [Zooshikella ganghwensis]
MKDFIVEIQGVRHLYIEIFIPIFTSLFFIIMRGKYNTKAYLITLFPFLLISLIVMISSKYVVFGFSGFKSWSLLAGFVSAFLICIYKASKGYIKFMQALFAFIVFEFWIMYTSWLV